MDYREWQIGNDTPVWNRPRLHIWFLFRYPDGDGNQRGRREDYKTPGGRLKQWACRTPVNWESDAENRQAAQRFADRLNGAY